MFVTNWNSTTKIQKISEITNFFRHYFLSRTEVCFGIQDKYFPRESALCAMYPFARSSFLLLKHKVYLLTGYIRIIRSTDADVLLP